MVGWMVGWMCLQIVLPPPVEFRRHLSFHQLLIDSLIFRDQPLQLFILSSSSPLCHTVNLHLKAFLSTHLSLSLHLFVLLSALHSFLHLSLSSIRLRSLFSITGAIFSRLNGLLIPPLTAGLSWKSAFSLSLSF